VHHIFRQIHSLKSAANLLGLSSIGQLCHRFEDVLAGYRDGEMTPGEGSEAEPAPTLETVGYSYYSGNNIGYTRGMEE
jgi:hypothetical protein